MSLLNKLGRYCGGMGLVFGLVACTQHVSPSFQAPSERGIVNGVRVTKKMSPLFGSIVQIVFRVGGGTASCTATHVGNGMFLTAYHCVGFVIERTGSKPDVVLIQAPHYEISPLISRDYYEVSSPEKVSERKISETLGGKTLTLREPDLSLIQFTGAVGKALSSLDKMKIGTRTLEVDEPDVHIAGYGLDSFELPPITGRLNAGLAWITDVSPEHYMLLFEEGERWAVTNHGDSGGPLFKFEGGDPVLYGVTSLGGPLLVEEDDTVLQSFGGQVRLDSESVQKWLKDALEPKKEETKTSAEKQEEKTSEAKPAEAKPAEVKPAEVKPAEVKPAEEKEKAPAVFPTPEFKEIELVF